MKVNFNATTSTDDGRIVDYAWNFGDGFLGNGLVAEHTYLFPGTYPVTLTVTDNNGKSSVMMQNVILTSSICENLNIIISSCVQITSTSQGVHLDATACGGGDGPYAWQFGNGDSASGNPVDMAIQAHGAYAYWLTYSLMVNGEPVSGVFECAWVP